jgi:predicted glycosyltransferase
MKSPPEVALSHQSPDICRVAFGLTIPIVVTADTPHATAVNTLTVPFASVLLIPGAILKALFRKYGAQNIR